MTSRGTSKKTFEWIRQYKELHGCEVCGEGRALCLDLHHRDRSEKSFGFSDKAGSRSFDKIIKEIAKCMVICANCHRLLHGQERLEAIAKLPDTEQEFPLWGE